LTVSTRCPSLRREISSISQMERWSSQTRMLAMRHLRVYRTWGRLGLRLRGPGMEDFQHKFRAAARPGLHVNLGAVGLHDLIDNRQAKPGAAFKMRLEGFEDLFRQVRRDARTSVTNADAQKIAHRADRDGERALAFHGAHGIFQQVPE